MGAEKICLCNYGQNKEQVNNIQVLNSISEKCFGRTLSSSLTWRDCGVDLWMEDDPDSVWICMIQSLSLRAGMDDGVLLSAAQVYEAEVRTQPLTLTLLAWLTVTYRCGGSVTPLSIHMSNTVIEITSRQTDIDAHLQICECIQLNNQD